LRAGSDNASQFTELDKFELIVRPLIDGSIIDSFKGRTLPPLANRCSRREHLTRHASACFTSAYAGELQAAHEASQLPELPSDETWKALNDLLLRVRLKSKVDRPRGEQIELFLYRLEQHLAQLDGCRGIGVRRNGHGNFACGDRLRSEKHPRRFFERRLLACIDQEQSSRASRSHQAFMMAA
jgi:hypothetical protein